MAVPWVWADGWWLGWQLRMAAASAAHFVLTPVLPDLLRQGTSLIAGGVEVDVAASCAGLGMFQATLIVGLAGVAYATRSAAWTVCSLPLLVLFAWAINTLRVVALTLVAVFGSPQLAGKTLHDAIGFALLGLAAYGGWAILDRLQRTEPGVAA